jgi:hypothetical protein
MQYATGEAIVITPNTETQRTPRKPNAIEKNTVGKRQLAGVADLIVEVQMIRCAPRDCGDYIIGGVP